MSQVKWVMRNKLCDKSNPELLPYEVPVVPLSALREVVEGLKWACEMIMAMTDKDDGAYTEAQRLLASLGAPTDSATKGEKDD